ELVRAGAAAAREGVALTPEQAYVIEILAPIYETTTECRDLYGLEGGLPGAGVVLRNPQLGDALELLGAEGDRPFYEGEVARAVLERLEGEGSLLTAADLAAYRALPLEPLHTRYRGRDVLTTPPPSAGGILIAYALARLERMAGAASPGQLVEVMEDAQAQRTAEFLEGLADPGFVERFTAARLGGTTHVSVLDREGMACSVTCSNGEGSAILVPGSGIHLNNMLGEQDLNPLGFHRHPPGRRLPSMMSPTVVMRDDAPELVIGSGGSNRIRSAILQTVVNVLDRGMPIDEAVRAPRLHFEEGVVYAEPDVDLEEVEASGHTVARFRASNLFFGGVHAVQAGNPPVGGGDPRRGGTVVVA
ncbi:MAG TPA: gamma-glutamyltransferase, partial [Solirubrobacteraceae bacterium]|nr:gamma-glutamyltransferase [Solirubrobacteraceae bacterium]